MYVYIHVCDGLGAWDGRSTAFRSCFLPGLVWFWFGLVEIGVLCVALAAPELWPRLALNSDPLASVSQVLELGVATTPCLLSLLTAFLLVRGEPCGHLSFHVVGDRDSSWLQLIPHFWRFSHL